MMKRLRCLATAFRAGVAATMGGVHYRRSGVFRKSFSSLLFRDDTIFSVSSGTGSRAAVSIIRISVWCMLQTM